MLSSKYCCTGELWLSDQMQLTPGISDAFGHLARQYIRILSMKQRFAKLLMLSDVDTQGLPYRSVRRHRAVTSRRSTRILNLAGRMSIHVGTYGPATVLALIIATSTIHRSEGAFEAATGRGRAKPTIMSVRETAGRFQAFLSQQACSCQPWELFKKGFDWDVSLS